MDKPNNDDIVYHSVRFVGGKKLMGKDIVVILIVGNDDSYNERIYFQRRHVVFRRRRRCRCRRGASFRNIAHI